MDREAAIRDMMNSMAKGNSSDVRKRTQSTEIEGC